MSWLLAILALVSRWGERTKVGETVYCYDHSGMAPMTFTEVLPYLLAGRRIRRKGWMRPAALHVDSSVCAAFGYDIFASDWEIAEEPTAKRCHCGHPEHGGHCGYRLGSGSSSCGCSPAPAEATKTAKIIARLTRERDDARAEVENLDCDVKARDLTIARLERDLSEAGDSFRSLQGTSQREIQRRGETIAGYVAEFGGLRSEMQDQKTTIARLERELAEARGDPGIECTEGSNDGKTWVQIVNGREGQAYRYIRNTFRH